MPSYDPTEVIRSIDSVADSIAAVNFAVSESVKNVDVSTRAWHTALTTAQVCVSASLRCCNIVLNCSASRALPVACRMVSGTAWQV